MCASVPTTGVITENPPNAQPGNIMLSERDDVLIAGFHSACTVAGAKEHDPVIAPADKPEYRAPEDAKCLLSVKSDIYSVATTIYKMATGKTPNLLDRDKLLESVEGGPKRDLVSFAFHQDPALRPTAEELLERIMILSPSSMVASEFRAQVFASLRFNEAGPWNEAKLLRGKLAAYGVHLHLVAPKAGESIDTAVFGAMAKCDAFIAMATKDVRVYVSSPAARSLPRNDDAARLPPSLKVWR